MKELLIYHPLSERCVSVTTTTLLAWRIHGGGFAGTTLNFVPLDMVEPFVDMMNRAFGEHACSVLNIRPTGAARIELNA